MHTHFRPVSCSGLRLLMGVCGFLGAVLILSDITLSGPGFMLKPHRNKYVWHVRNVDILEDVPRMSDLHFITSDNMPLTLRIGDYVFGIIAWPVVTFYLYVLNDNSNYSIHSRVAALNKAAEDAMKQRKRNEPIALPYRRRALSITPQTPKSWPFTLWREDSVQQRPSRPSPLLRLPLELREKIFADVLGHGILHLTQLPKRLGHTRCTTGSTEASPGDVSRLCFSPSKVHHYRHGECLNLTGKSSGNCITLLQTCRQIYNEASPLLYRSNIFDINHPQTLIFLARTIRPNRLASIRSLQLTWTGRLPMPENDAAKEPDDWKTWEEMWNVVGTQMAGLTSLRLRLCLVEGAETGDWLSYTRKNWTRDRVLFEKMLVPLKDKVRGLRDFQLAIEMPEEVEWSVGELEERARGWCVN